VSDVRAVVRQVDPRLALADVRTMDEVVDNALRRQRISAVLLSCFAVGALLLAAMGLFGIVSGSVTRRRHELALRLAVGADHGRLVRLILGEGAALVVAGVLIGLRGIYIAGGLLSGVLAGVSPLDPLTLVSVALGLGLVTMVACYLPARRVLRIDPAQSLRQE
jgi:putative ABC transport system permease protein